MAQPGDTITRTFKVVDAAGAAVTGLNTASFTCTGYRNGSASTISHTVVEIGSGRYSVAYVLPSSAGLVDAWFTPVSASNYIVWPDLTEEVESYDLTALYGAVVKTTISLNATGAPTNEIELRFIKNDYHSVTFNVRDSAGVAVDLSAWDTWRFGVKNADQSTVGGVVPYLQTTGITANASGVVTIVVPETASFFGLLTTGQASTTGARWSLEGNEAADATKTRTVGRGVCTVLRKETL